MEGGLILNIFCDFHHSDLWWSHSLIFESGLGHTLFRPRGMEWFEAGYYNNAPDVAKQFLIDSMFTVPIARRFERAVDFLKGKDDSLYVNCDNIHGCQYYPLMHTIELRDFPDAKIDVVMSSTANNQEGFLRLRNDLAPNAKMLREEGNINGWAHLHPGYKNVMTTDMHTHHKCESHKVLYHQRFRHEDIFRARTIDLFGNIACFMPGFKNVPFLVDFATEHMKLLPGFDFRNYGPGSQFGCLSTKSDLAERMADSTFVWHVKPGGDGFGHVVHNAFAVGRPVLTVGHHYDGQLASVLMEDGVTFISLDEKDIQGNVDRIASLSHEEIVEMGKNAQLRFREKIDYGHELSQIDGFMNSLE